MLKMGFGKLGQEPTTIQLWFVVIGLILAFFVSCSSVHKTYSDLNGKTYEKNYFARDIALAVDAVYAAPGDVEYTYSMKRPEYKFVIELKNSKVFVKEKIDDPDTTAGIYDYFWNTDKPLDVSISPLPDNPKPMLIIFAKKDGVLSIKAENADLKLNVAHI